MEPLLQGNISLRADGINISSPELEDTEMLVRSTQMESIQKVQRIFKKYVMPSMYVLRLKGHVNTGEEYKGKGNVTVKTI